MHWNAPFPGGALSSEKAALWCPPAPPSASCSSASAADSSGALLRCVSLSLVRSHHYFWLLYYFSCFTALGSTKWTWSFRGSSRPRSSWKWYWRSRACRRWLGRRIAAIDRYTLSPSLGTFSFHLASRGYPPLNVPSLSCLIVRECNILRPHSKRRILHSSRCGHQRTTWG